MNERFSERKIVLVRRATRLDGLIARFNTSAQARFYVEHLGADFSDYEQEHEEYRLALRGASEALQRFGRVYALERNFLPNFNFAPDDLVVAVGQDGLVANTLKYLSGQPLIGVNPSPSRWDGILLPFLVGDLDRVMREVLRGRRPLREISFALASLKDGQSLLAVNDLFIGQRTHASARYSLRFGGKAENQSSSGVIVSTGLGSTGWLSSILAGVGGIVGNIGGKKSEVKAKEPMPWDADFLYYTVREPFPSKATGVELVFGKVTSDSPLRIESRMAENGVIFSDGIENDYLEFNSGMEAEIRVAEKKGILVV